MSKRQSLDLRWLLLIPVLVSLVLVGAWINNNLGNAPTATPSLSIDNNDLEINWSNYSVYNLELEGALKITKSGTYYISGSLENAGITVDAHNAFVKIVLKDVNITNPNGPAVSCVDGDYLVIESVGKNYLEDGKNYSKNLDIGINGAIYSKANLVFQGNGSLKVVSNYQDGIISKDNLTFRSGTYNIESADDAIRGKDSVRFVGGSFTIKSVADAIKSTNETDQAKGFIYIENGEFVISSGDDGIHAENQIIIEDGDIDIAKSYEGIEAPNITINNGDIKVKATDDGVNAGRGSSESNTPRPGGMMDADENCILTINGGNIYVNAAGDGIDSNGYVYINGGRLVVDGPTNNGNGALDSGLGFIMNGGTAMAVGSNGMAETFGEKSTIYNISVNLKEAAEPDTKIIIVDEDDNIILEHTSVKAFTNIAAASPDFVLGKEYTIYLNNNKYESFTIGGITTRVGNNSNHNNFRK